MRRYPPLTLYLDTEVFRRAEYKFNSEDFNTLKNISEKGGLRLLVPEMMERELFRKFQEQANNAADAFNKFHSTHPVQHFSLGSFPDKDTLREMCLVELEQQWEEFKQHFTIEQLPVVGNVTDVMDWYFQGKAPFSKGKKAEFPDAFILSSLESYQKEYQAYIAVISFDKDFAEACASRRYIEYYPKLQEYIKEFKPDRDKEPSPIDPTQPIITEDLTEIKSILNRGDKATIKEIGRVIELILNRGTNYQYFFFNARHTIWIKPLIKCGVFDIQPEILSTIDGHKFFYWTPINYLKKVFDQEQETVLEILEKLPDTNNHSILDGIFNIVLKSDSTHVLQRFASKIISFINHPKRNFSKVVKLFNRPWFFERPFDFELSLVSMAVEFLPDPQSSEKLALWNENQENYWAALLTPGPRFRDYEYQQILENGVRPLAERNPQQIARILSDAVAAMLPLQKHETEPGTAKDNTDLLCHRLDSTNLRNPPPEEILVQTLTFACRQVFEKSPESIANLNTTLRSQRWKIFNRLRQHLYALYPSEQTKPWIKEFILSYPDYAELDYHYEFQQMIRFACENFGSILLTEEERTRIFDAIISGPSKATYRVWMDDKFTEDNFKKYQQEFHWKQLKPFSTVLFGEYSNYFYKLEIELEGSISDEDYSRTPKIESTTAFYRSPRPPEELASLSDEQLLAYINEWQGQHDPERDWMEEVNIHELSGAFQTVFRETIIPSKKRLSFWLRNRNRIQRPAYVRAMVDAMQEEVKERKFTQINQWLNFCQWVLTHEDKSFTSSRYGDESSENPNWTTSRRSVGDFVKACFDEDIDFLTSVRRKLANLLKNLCTQPDWKLDQNEWTIITDLVNTAINTTRGRALESLVSFGFWIRKHKPRSKAPEVTTILKSRFSQGDKLPLTLPEYAILGLHYCDFVLLNQTWAQAHKATFFPQDNLRAWKAAFSAVIKYGRPSELGFNHLKENYIFALAHLTELMPDPQKQEDRGNKIVDRLGQHLFTYYLWDMYPLKGNESLLEQFYEETKETPEYWENLFHHVGFSLGNARELEENLVTRAIAFFDWRFAAQNLEELHSFSHWLDARCLSAEWRLKAFYQILDSSNTGSEELFHTIPALTEMLEEHPQEVVKCFARLTDLMSDDTYINIDKAQSILDVGFGSDDEKTYQHAERALERLLRLKYFDLLKPNN